MGWVVRATPRPFYPRKSYPVRNVQEAGWTPGPVWTGAENFTFTGIRSPDRPVRSEQLYRLSHLPFFRRGGGERDEQSAAQENQLSGASDTAAPEVCMLLLQIVGIVRCYKSRRLGVLQCHNFQKSLKIGCHLVQKLNQGTFTQTVQPHPFFFYERVVLLYVYYWSGSQNWISQKFVFNLKYV